MPRDKLYDGHEPHSEGAVMPVAPFEFNAAVVEVFPDMIRRSVPGYSASLSAIQSLARRYAQRDTQAYDLGCSLGAATLAMRHGIAGAAAGGRAEEDAASATIIAVDNSPAMIARCREILALDDATIPVQLLQADVRDIPIERASMVVMNYTLQFVPRADRGALLKKICTGMLPGGVLVLSEKIVDPDPFMNRLLIDLHHEHKQENAYSALEISRKRTALENVLIPESIETHRQRLVAAGFCHIGQWLQHYNFVSLVAFKGDYAEP